MSGTFVQKKKISIPWLADCSDIPLVCLRSGRHIERRGFHPLLLSSLDDSLSEPPLPRLRERAHVCAEL